MKNLKIQNVSRIFDYDLRDNDYWREWVSAIVGNI